jgi:hypothetical protein
MSTETWLRPITFSDSVSIGVTIVNGAFPKNKPSAAVSKTQGKSENAVKSFVDDRIRLMGGYPPRSARM